jgi:hypothetical protein
MAKNGAKNIILEASWGFTKKDAQETLRNLRRAGLVPADLKVDFVSCGGGVGLHGSRAAWGSTSGARFLASELQGLLA